MGCSLANTLNILVRMLGRRHASKSIIVLSGLDRLPFLAFSRGLRLRLRKVFRCTNGY